MQIVKNMSPNGRTFSPSKSCAGPLLALHIVILIVVKFVLMLDSLSNKLFYMIKM